MMVELGRSVNEWYLAYIAPFPESSFPASQPISKEIVAEDPDHPRNLNSEAEQN
jgi:hypothetical protein